jgi:hypothetical protein
MITALSSLALVVPLLALAAAGALFLYGRLWGGPARALASAGAFALVLWATFTLGKIHERERGLAHSLRVELAAAQADIAAARRLNSQTLKRMAEADSLAALNAEKIDALAQDLAQRPGPHCLLDDADARRLRHFGEPAQP